MGQMVSRLNTPLPTTILKFEVECGTSVFGVYIPNIPFRVEIMSFCNYCLHAPRLLQEQSHNRRDINIDPTVGAVNTDVTRGAVNTVLIQISNSTILVNIWTSVLTVASPTLYRIRIAG